ncbi:MAG: hypothetical protein HY711_02605 [Candidatus Melainabacteria bacterium]|nr:hypothetical protein [Candidatus Melainabacteria bacterium]
MKKISTQWFTLLELIVLSLLFGAIISLYILGVNQFTVRSANDSPVDEAALLAARELQGTVVVSPSFGKIGLCNLPATRSSNSGVLNQGVIGLNSIYANLRLNALIAEHIKHPLILKLVCQDLDDVHRLEGALRLKMYQAVQPSLYYSDAAIHVIHARVNEYLSSHKISDREVLVGCRITLGKVISQDVSSGIPVAAGEEKAFLDSNAMSGFYKPYIQLPVPGTQSVQFIAIADKAKLISPREFVRADTSVTPSAVLVEAEYKKADLSHSGKAEPTVRRVSCAVVGGFAPCEHRSVFMISFPHGAPPKLRSMADLLFNKSDKSGFWQQAIGGETLSYMSLGPVANQQLGEMQLSDAVAVALYHWLRQLGPAINVTNVLSLVYQVWSSPGAEQVHGAQLNAKSAAGNPPEQTPLANTCLAKDTGAPEYAIFNQTGFGGLGRAALGSAFALWGSNQALPPSALPLYVNAAGECNLPSRYGLDERLVKDFLVSLHRTNLAGIESQAMARIMSNRADLTLQQLSKDSLLSREELRSLSQRLDRIKGQGKTLKAISNEVVLLNNRAKMLNQQLRAVEAKQHLYFRKKALCSIVLANGEKAASKSFAVCFNMKQMIGTGLYRVEAPEPGFLLGKGLYFVPRINPATEDEINEAALDERLIEASSWVSREFLVFKEAHEPMVVEGLSLSEIVSRHELAMPMRPFVAILDSQAVMASKTPAVKIFERSPFTNVPLTVGNLVYYARNALTTGRKTKVWWSVLIRDLAALPQDYNGEGFPLSYERDWCRQGYLAPVPCPGLACELQVRSPIPELPHLEMGATLSNPNTGEHVSQVPPVPPNML